MKPFNRVLVTGGAGFIGSSMVHNLVSENYEMVVLDNFSSGKIENLRNVENSRNVTIIKGDINDADTVRTAMSDVEVVFHEAALDGAPGSLGSAEVIDKVNVDGTKVVLEAAMDSGVKRFVFASSAAVYGVTTNSPVTEDTPPAPISALGKSKLAAEELCFAANEDLGLDVVVLRYFNVYGPRSRSGAFSNVIDKFAEQMVKKEAPVIVGTGSQSRDFIHVHDVARATVLAARKKVSSGKVYNVATGRGVTIERLADLMNQMIHGENILIPFDFRPAMKEDIVDRYADISLIKRELGFEPEYSIEVGLLSYLEELFPSKPIGQLLEAPSVAK